MTLITVMGATGRTGGALARQLLGAGVRVRALGRSARGLDALAALGAETRRGDASDAAFLAQAFAGADAAYVLMPHDPAAAGFEAQQRVQGEAIAQALRASAVQRVVALSSLGAEQPSGTGVIVSLHEQEQRLRAAAADDLLLLRPGMYFEVYGALLPVIRAAGMLPDALAPQQPVPMVATRDVAAAACRALLDGAWHGSLEREVHGPRPLTSAEIARILAQALGLPSLPYVQLPYEATVRALVEAGLAPDVAALTVDMERAINEGRIRTVLPPAAVVVGTTTFERYAAELAQAAPAD